MQQEEVDSKLHETGGSIPVHDKISLPAAGTGARELLPDGFYIDICEEEDDVLLTLSAAVKGKEKAVVEDDEEEELRKLQAEMAM